MSPKWNRARCASCAGERGESCAPCAKARSQNDVATALYCYVCLFLLSAILAPPSCSAVQRSDLTFMLDAALNSPQIVVQWKDHIVADYVVNTHESKELCLVQQAE